MMHHGAGTWLLLLAALAGHASALDRETAASGDERSLWSANGHAVAAPPMWPLRPTSSVYSAELPGSPGGMSAGFAGIADARPGVSADAFAWQGRVRYEDEGTIPAQVPLRTRPHSVQSRVSAALKLAETDRPWIGWDPRAPAAMEANERGAGEPVERGVRVVELRIPDRYLGTPVEWSAVPLSVPGAAEAWAPSGAVAGTMLAELEPGEWAIFGQGQGPGPGEGLRFATRVRVGEHDLSLMVPMAPPGFNPASPAQSRALPLSIAKPQADDPSSDDVLQGHGPDDGYVCPELSWTRQPCPFIDESAQLGFVLPQGMQAGWPMFYTTAAGVRAEEPTLEIYRSESGSGAASDVPVAVLNPRQWLVSNGPCITTSVGSFCLWIDPREPFDAERQELLDAFVGSVQRYPAGTDFEAPGMLERLLRNDPEPDDD